MQMIINVILSAIIAVWFLAGAIPFALPTWIAWVFGIAAALALVLSFFTSGRK